MDYMSWADTGYKRLWHQGFKGKFYSFRWPTFSGDNNGLPYGLDEQLEGTEFPPGGTTYNSSEYRAWLCGPQLASFVNQLPDSSEKRNLFAHSMGNVITGAVLRSGMRIFPPIPLGPRIEGTLSGITLMETLIRRGWVGVGEEALLKAWFADLKAAG